MEKVRMAVIGLGQRGSGLTDTLLAIEEADITYVCDLYEDRIADETARIEKARGVKPQGTTEKYSLRPKSTRCLCPPAGRNTFPSRSRR